MSSGRRRNSTTPASPTCRSKEYNKAAKAFDEVDRQHPYSPWATQGQLMSAYANYLQDKYDDALISLSRFIDLHPGNKSAAYAYYLKAICYYEQIVDVGRDQKNTQQAFDALNDVVTRFPNTDYARDAALSSTSPATTSPARTWRSAASISSASNTWRPSTASAASSRTTRPPPMCRRRSSVLTECYLALGVKDEAQNAAAVLGYNYPGSDWYHGTATTS